jgi:hypothetical protein
LMNVRKKTWQRSCRMIKTFARHKRFVWIGIALLCGTETASAQWWGTNATPCSNGHCAPTTPYGYVPTHWHQWPGAVYPDMARPTPAGEEIPPSRVEVPPQNRELEIPAPSIQVPQKSGEGTESNELLPTPGIQPLPARPEKPSSAAAGSWEAVAAGSGTPTHRTRTAAAQVTPGQ